MTPRRLALFGGTFDPVHNAHLKLAEWVHQKLFLDQVVFVPNFLHPFHKRKNITEAPLRLKMLKIAIRNYPYITSTPFEIENKQISYSVDTLRYFRKKYPDAELFFLIGADNVPDFDRWKEAQEILSLCTVAVYSRELSDLPKQERFHYLDNPCIHVASTDIRHRLAHGQNCDDLVPADVLEFIQQNQIYQVNKPG